VDKHQHTADRRQNRGPLHNLISCSRDTILECHGDPERSHIDMSTDPSAKRISPPATQETREAKLNLDSKNPQPDVTLESVGPSQQAASSSTAVNKSDKPSTLRFAAHSLTSGQKTDGTNVDPRPRTNILDSAEISACTRGEAKSEDRLNKQKKRDGPPQDRQPSSSSEGGESGSDTNNYVLCGRKGTLTDKDCSHPSHRQ